MEQVLDLIKHYKFKLLLDDEDLIPEDDLIFFCHKDYVYFVQIEDINNLTFGISRIEKLCDDYEFSDFYSRFDEYGDINNFEQFLDDINEGHYLHVKNMYKDIVKLFEKYKDNDHHLNNLIQYFLFV